MTYELYRKMIKEEMEYNETSGQMPKGDILEYAFKQLSVIDTDVVNIQIENYRKRKAELIKQYAEVNEQINKLVEQYYSELMKTL